MLYLSPMATECRQVQQACQGGLAAGHDELAALVAAADRKLTDISVNLQRLWAESLQANADLKVC